MKQILTLVLCALLIVACQTQPTKRGPSKIVPDSPPTYSGQPLALVIGNSQYEYRSLANPINDATDMAAQLRAMDFEVTLELDLNQVEMGNAIRAFTTRLANTPGIGLFYFAGHGAQADGDNYLLPIDNNKIGDKQDLKAYAVNVSTQVLERMEQANRQLNIIMLDACRDEPYRGAKRAIGERGLARMQSVQGSILAFATAPREVAADTSVVGRNGIYTKYLLQGLKKAQQIHQRIDDMLMEVRNGVVNESGGGQEPWYSASLQRPFCFGGCLTGNGYPMHTTTMALQPPSNPVSPTQSIAQTTPTYSVTSSYRYTDNGNGTVTDNRSGLIWLKNANCFDEQNWETAMRSAANLASGQCGLRDGSRRGMWRLPTQEEWEAMRDTKYKDPALSNAAGTGPWKEGDTFKGVQFWYWSSSTYAGQAHLAWYVDLKAGNVDNGDKGGMVHVWPVRRRH